MLKVMLVMISLWSLQVFAILDGAWESDCNMHHVSSGSIVDKLGKFEAEKLFLNISDTQINVGVRYYLEKTCKTTWVLALAASGFLEHLSNDNFMMIINSLTMTSTGVGSSLNKGQYPGNITSSMDSALQIEMPSQNVLIVTKDDGKKTVYFRNWHSTLP